MAQDNRVEDLIQRVARNTTISSNSNSSRNTSPSIASRWSSCAYATSPTPAACNHRPSCVFAPSISVFGLLGPTGRLSRRLRQRYDSGKLPPALQAVISDHPAQMQSSELARSFLDTCQAGIANVKSDLDDRAFEKAVTILQNAEHIYIMGVRRMFPVASYRTYSLSQTRKRVIMVDGVGGLYKGTDGGLSKG